MGLVRAAINAASGVFADQFKEYFACDALSDEVLMARGARMKGGRSANKGDDNIITTGSIVTVANGQCMMIVDQGKIVEFSAEPGAFTYDASTEPSIFCGDFKEGVQRSFESFAKRFAFGGQNPKNQRVYYFNTKEIIGNKYGTATPVPFRVLDERAGIDMDIGLRSFGEYSYHICDPVLFYTNVCGNVEDEYRRQELDSQLKTELLTALQPAFAKIGAMGIRYSEVPAHTMELADALNEVLSKKWREKRGIEIVSFGVSSITANPEDEKTIKEMQKTAALRDASLAGATLVGAQAEAMKAAASNPNAGPAMAFMGMNMAAQAGGANAAQFYQMGGQGAPMQNQNPQQPAMQPQQSAGNMQQQTAASWTCSCGTVNTGNFCGNCGKQKPQPAFASWTCSCGAVNTGNFCNQCGKPRA